MSDNAIDTVFSIVNKKRKTTKVLSDYKVRGFSKHLNNAQKQGANTVALIGEDEMTNGTIWIKNLETKEESKILLEDFY